MSDAEDQPWRAAIRRPDGRVAGAGFLLRGRQVLTCAHVVADALGVSASGLATGHPRTDNLPAHDGWIQQLATTILPNGQPIVVTSGGDGTIRLWDLEHAIEPTDPLPAHKPAGPLGVGGVEQLAVTTLPDGHPIAITGGSDGSIRLWDLQTGTPRTDPLPGHAVGLSGFSRVQQLAVATLPDGKAIAITGGDDGTIRLWDLQTGTPRTNLLPAHDPGDALGGGVQQLATTTLPDGQVIAITGGGDGTIRLWDLQTGTPRTHNLPAHQPVDRFGGGGGVQQLAVTTLPGGQPLAVTGGGDGTIRFWDLQTGTPRTDNLPAHQPRQGFVGGVQQLAVATLPDGQAIAITGGLDGTIRLWDLQTGTPHTDPLPAHDGRVQQLTVTSLPDGLPIAITAGGDRVCTYDLSAGCIWQQVSVGSQVHAIAVLPDGLVVVGARMGLLGLRDVLPGTK